MANYSEKAAGSRIKILARKIVTQPHLNRAIIALATRLPNHQPAWVARLPVVGRTAQLSLPGVGEISLTDTDRCQIAKEVFWSGGQLEKPSDRLALEAAIKLTRSPGIFLDVGAYTGLFALAVARAHPTVTAYAYDIVPENYLSIWRNVFANDLVGRVIPRLTGLGLEAGEIRVPVSFAGGPLASSVALDAEEPSGIRIPIDALDTQHAGYTGHAVIKIDVETFEWPVLAGGRRFIEHNRPDIICEILRRASNIPEISAFLRSTGYEFYHITAGGLKPSAEIKPVAHERDWLFTTRSERELASLDLEIARPQ